MPDDQKPFVVSPVLTDRRKLVLVGVVFLLALVYLMYVAFQGAATYYLTVGELVDKGESVYGDTVRVNGSLLPDSFEREYGNTTALFSLTDGNDVLHASYSGPIPDLFFNEHSEIVVEGKYDGPHGAFEADNIIVKCPSKYQEL
jgi:cytochrome c-type biogenesis protein CcmE